MSPIPAPQGLEQSLACLGGVSSVCSSQNWQVSLPVVILGEMAQGMAMPLSPVT